jgi:hypothetical protein
MSSTVVISGQLLRDGKAIRDIKLKLTFKEHRVDESAAPVARTIERYELVPTSGLDDGRYTLRYVFDSKQKEDSVRVQGGRLLAG